MVIRIVNRTPLVLEVREKPCFSRILKQGEGAEFSVPEVEIEPAPWREWA